MNYQKGLKPGYGIGYQGLFRDERDDLMLEVESLKAEVERLKEELEEADPSGDLRREYWKIAHQILDYVYMCADKHIVPLKHDANIFNAKLNAARNNRRKK